MAERPEGPFFFVAAEGTDPAAIGAALDGIEDPFSVGEEPLFPRTAHTARCRICGEIRTMTEEHIPPRGAFNKGRGMEIDPVSRLGNDDLDHANEKGPVRQGGIRAHVLCRDCNNLTGRRWGREYQGWATRAFHLVADHSPDEIDEEPGFPVFGGAFKGVYPGRFVRQVLSMMLSISGGSDLADRLPVLRALVLGGPPATLPEDVRLYMHLYGSSNSRVIGGARGQLTLDLETGVASRLLQIDHPPFGFMLQLQGPDLEMGLEISSFTEIEVDRKIDLEFEDLPLGFGHKPWASDYRTKGQMIADRG